MKPAAGRVPSEVEAAGLLCGAPSVVLTRILADDPLGLRVRIAARLEGCALLFDLDRALLCVQASVALRAGGWRGEGELGAWLEQRVDEALAPLLGGDRTGAASPALARLCGPLGLDGERLEVACLCFNRLPLEERRAFFALVLEGASPDSFARSQALALGELARRTRRSLEPFRALASSVAPAQPAAVERRA